MTSDLKILEETIDKHRERLKSVGDGIVDGALEGFKGGVAWGVKKGSSDGLKECLSQGFGDIGDEDIQDLLRGIPVKIIRSSVKEGVRRILTKSTRDYVESVYRKIMERIRKGDVKLSGDQAGKIPALLKKAEREAMKNFRARLPDNFFLREIMAGMQKSLEESLEKNYKSSEEKLRKEIDNRP